MIFRRFAFAVGLLGAALLSQLPEFTQQYRQRLGGAVDELAAIVARFDAESAAQSLTRAQGIDRLEHNPDVLARQRGSGMAETAARLDRLRRQDAAFASAGPVSQYAVLAADVDRGIAGQAYGAYQPALPVTPAGLASAAAGFLVGWLAMHLLAWPVRRRRAAPARSAQPSSSI